MPGWNAETVVAEQAGPVSAGEPHLRHIRILVSLVISEAGFFRVLAERLEARRIDADVGSPPLFVVVLVFAFVGHEPEAVPGAADDHLVDYR